MKSFVFSVNRNQHNFAHRYFVNKRFISLKEFFYYYSVHLLFFLVFVTGIIFGSFSVSNANKSFLDSLDFLFVTNLSARLELSAFTVFCSSLASNFIFVFSAFLMAFSAWGIASLPLLSAFKGYGVGVSSAYLFLQHSITGIGFYILVILPGTVLFLFAFIIALKESMTASFGLFKFYVTSKPDFVSQKQTKVYLFRYSFVLIFAALSSLLDMLLWMIFANMFNF